MPNHTIVVRRTIDCDEHYCLLCNYMINDNECAMFKQMLVQDDSVMDVLRCAECLNADVLHDRIKDGV